MFIELRDVYEDNLFLVFSSLKKTRRRHQPRWDEIAERRLLDLVASQGEQGRFISRILVYWASFGHEKNIPAPPPQKKI